MPAAVPLAVMAAGAVASKVASNKQAKQQNQNNQAADAKYNDLNTGFGNQMADIGNQNRAQNQGLMNSILGGAGSLWDAAGSQNQPSFNPKMSDSQGFYKNAMNTGLFDQNQMNDYRARGALQNTALFSALKRNMDENANIHGGNYAGYSGQSAKLGRDTARQAEENRLGTETSLQDMIRQNMFSGAGGVASNDRDFANQNLQSAQLQGQNLDRTFGQRNSMLGLLQGLRTQGTNDASYYNQAGDAYRGYRTTPTLAQTPWYGTVGDAAQGVGSAYMSGGFGGNKVATIPKTKYNFNQLG